MPTAVSSPGVLVIVQGVAIDDGLNQLVGLHEQSQGRWRVEREPALDLPRLRAHPTCPGAQLSIGDIYAGPIHAMPREFEPGRDTIKCLHCTASVLRCAVRFDALAKP